MSKCYYCEKTENLQKTTIQTKDNSLLVSLCPEHYKAREKERELIRQNHRAQFGEN